MIGLFAWDVSRQLSSRMSGSPPLGASVICVVRSLADVVRINWTFLNSNRCEECLARCYMHTHELLVLLIENPMLLPLRPYDFLELLCPPLSLMAQAVSFLDEPPEDVLVVMKRSWYCVFSIS